MAEKIVVEILTKKDCCLCDTAKATLDRVLPDYPARLKIVDINSDSGLLERYGKKIPVVLINGRESFVYKVHETTLRKKLEKVLADG